MAVTPSFRDYVLEQLTGLGRVRPHRMFGGVGLYCDERFFALIADDALYLKVDDVNRDDFVRRGMKAFCPYRDRPEWEMGYYEVPADVLEDAEAMTAWARKSVRAALAAPARKATRKPARKPKSKT